MRRVSYFAAAAVLSIGLLGLIGCRGGSKPLNAGGSSFVDPLMSKWTDEYNRAKKVRINYQAIGSGGGIQQMTEKTLDFGCTDGPMSADQLAKAKDLGGEVLHIPLAMGGIVPAYNLAEVKEGLNFSGPVLADIYLGKIARWNDGALQKLNPGVALPDKAIGVVFRSDGSGSTYVFTDYLAKVSPESKEKIGMGTAVKFPVGGGKKGTEGVAGAVKGNPGSIGYIELIYALKNDIQYGAVKNKDGEFVKASLESVTAAAANSLSDIPDDLRYSITDAPGKESYPISATTWAVIYQNQPADKGQSVIDFLRWVTHEGQELAPSLQYARLPKSLIEKVEKKLDTAKVGQ